jgi:hypothetical protein
MLKNSFALNTCSELRIKKNKNKKYVQAGLAMNGIFEVLAKNKKYIEFYNTARARRPRARADHAT